MSDIQVPEGWLATDAPGVMFEDNHIGRMKKELWEAHAQMAATSVRNRVRPR